MTTYTLYSMVTGEIRAQLGMSLADILHPANGNFDQITEGLLEGAFEGDDVYAPNGIVTPRPMLPVEAGYTLTSDGAATLDLIGLPAGTIANISDPSKTGRDAAKDVLHGTIDDDGKLSWSTSIPGEYDLVLLPPFPWKLARVRIVANAAG